MIQVVFVGGVEQVLGELLVVVLMKQYYDLQCQNEVKSFCKEMKFGQGYYDVLMVGMMSFVVWQDKLEKVYKDGCEL